MRRTIVLLLCVLALGTVHTAGAQAATVSDTTSIRGFVSKVSGLWVSGEHIYPGGDNGMLRARANGIGPWETFAIVTRSDGTSVLRAVATGRYVSAEFAYPGERFGMLRARATVIGPWETFYVSYYSQYQAWVIQSAATGLYVSAELAYPAGDYGMLRARAGSIGPWELFDLGRPS